MMHAGVGAARIVRQDPQFHRQLPGHKCHSFWRSTREIIRDKPHEAQRTQFQPKPEASMWPRVHRNLRMILLRQGKERDQVLSSTVALLNSIPQERGWEMGALMVT